jgi:hypothetical protein
MPEYFPKMEMKDYSSKQEFISLQDTVNTQTNAGTYSESKIYPRGMLNIFLNYLSLPSLFKI